MTEETGTLKELDVKPGDVVELEGCVGEKMVVIKCPPRVGAFNDHWELDCEKTGLGFYSPNLKFTLISRAPEASADLPKLWKDMSPEEKGALLLARHEGCIIQLWENGKWVNDPVAIHKKFAYRVKPEPVVETVALYNDPNGGWSFYEDSGTYKISHRITFDLVDGKPDCNSVKMEEI